MKGGAVIDQADARMIEWAQRTVPEAKVRITPPADGTIGIQLFLLGIAPVPTPRGASRPPLELALDYLVATESDDPIVAHRWLGQLAFSAMDVPLWRLAGDAVSLDFWRAFGVPPRPAFTVRVPLRLERAEQPVPVVTKPIELRMTSIASLIGDVVGPGGVPIAGASIEVPALQLFTRSDADGSFAFPTVPAGTPVALIVRAKRRTLRLQARSDERLRIEINLEE